MTGTINSDTYGNIASCLLWYYLDLFCGSTGTMSRKDEVFT